jgi:diaminopimelate decarboxylase
MNPVEQLPVPADAGALAALDPGIWPATATRADGTLAVGGLPVAQVASQYGTPVMILDEVDFRARAAAFRDAYADAEVPGVVSYAGKAFLSTTTLGWLAADGLSLDVCSGGELAVALAAGFPANSITFHGNNKSDAELREALSAGVGKYVLDSLEEVDRLGDLAGTAGMRARVLVRVTAGVEAHTHEFIATAHEDQKFGLSLASGTARAAVLAVVARPELELVGIHSHIGSQIFDTSGFEVAASRVVAFAADLRIHDGIGVTELNLGGGMGIAYVTGDDPIAPQEMAHALREIVQAECQRRGIPVPTLAVEPGRAIVGPAMVTVYEVGTVKPVEYAAGQVRTYVSVDGGMSDNIRTALYDAEYTVTLASRTSQAAPMKARVVGKHCESGDIIVADTWLPSDLHRGDLLAVAATGAYCRSMASSYNWVGRPPVIAVRDGNTKVVLRREGIADLLALDPGAGPA